MWYEIGRDIIIGECVYGEWVVEGRDRGENVIVFFKLLKYEDVNGDIILSLFVCI